MSAKGQNRTFVAGFLRNGRHAERPNGRCSVLRHWAGPRSAASGGIGDMIVGPRGTTFGVARSVSVDCAFRTHAHVLVWSYWPSVRYCRMNCPTERRVPAYRWNVPENRREHYESTIVNSDSRSSYMRHADRGNGRAAQAAACRHLERRFICKRE